jgi:hypothetical protein
MKNGRADSPSNRDEAACQESPVGGEPEKPLPWKRGLRLGPTAAIVVAAAGLALIYELDTNHFGFQFQTPPSSSPDEAVDISLRRLVRTRIADRFRREKGLSGSLLEIESAIDDEFARIREHPLYLMIKEKMANHLRNAGYENVPIKKTPDPQLPMMLSIEAETALHNFTHSMRANCHAPNGKAAALLRYQEEHFGKSIAAHDGTGGYDVALSFLIQLLFECPDDLSKDVDAFRFFPIATEELEAGFRGKAPD